jgi:hypothetical protein
VIRDGEMLSINSERCLPGWWWFEWCAGGERFITTIAIDGQEKRFACSPEEVTYSLIHRCLLAVESIQAFLAKNH